MSNTGPESTGPPAAAGGGRAGLSPAAAGAGQGRGDARSPAIETVFLLGDTTTLADPIVVEEIRDRAVSEGLEE